jgi:hypothetical protein
MEQYLNQNESQLENRNKINLGVLFLILFLISGVFIYIYSGFEYNYLKFLFSYSMIWQISLILVGLWMFKIKNIIDLSIGFLFVIFSLSLITISIFNYQFSIKDNTQNNLIQTDSVNKIIADTNFVFSEINVNSGEINKFSFDFKSNYDMAKFEQYKDDEQSQIINLNQKLFPPGLGMYNKSNELFLPKSTPFIFNTKSNLSNLKFNLSNTKLVSSNIEISNSQLQIKVDNLDIQGESILNLKSIFSIVDIQVSKNIQIILTNSSKLSFNSFQGIEKDNSNSTKYKSAWVPMQYNSASNSDSNLYKTEQKTIDDELSNEIKTKSINYQKTLIINLDSTLSRIKISQK